MAQKNLAVLKLTEILDVSPYALRYRFDDEILRASIQKHGVLMPIVVTKKGTVIAGHKRVWAARAMGLSEIPICVLDTSQAEPTELLMIFLISNWQQNLKELDRAWILKGVRQAFNLTERVLLAEVMPLLGVRGEKHVLTDCLETVSLQAELIQCIDEGLIPFRGAKALGILRYADQQDFARCIARKIHLTTNQLLQVSEWVHDLIKIEEVSLRQYLAKGVLKSILEDPKHDPLQNAARFVQVLRHLRFPALVEKEDQFYKIKHQIDSSDPEVAVEMNPYFEDQGYVLRAKLRKPDSVGTLESFLREKREMLNSLFAIML